MQACEQTPVEPEPEPATRTWSLDSAPQRFYALAVSGNEVVAVGSSGTYRYDGATWQRIANGINATRANLSPAGELYAVVGHRVMHLVGEDWTEMLAVKGYTAVNGGPEPIPLNDIAVIDENNIVVVGNSYCLYAGPYWICKNNIYRFNGSSWKDIGPWNSEVDMRSVWGNSAHDVFIGAGAGRMLHYDGATLVPMDIPTGRTITGIWGRSNDDVYAVTPGLPAEVLHYDGVSWQTINASLNVSVGAIHEGGGGVIASGSAGYAIYDGSNWSSGTVAAHERVMGIWGRSSNDLFAITDGSMLHHDGAKWRRLMGGSNVQWNGVWVAENGEAFAVNEKGIERRDATGWQPMIGQGGLAIWGRSSSDVYIVGGEGTINHYDGSEWRPMQSGTTQELRGIWGTDDRTIVAGQSVILSNDGGGWVQMQGDIPQVEYRGVWGTSNDNVFVVGGAGTILHYDGAEWTPMKTGQDAALAGVWGSSETDVYAVGENAPFDGPTRYIAATILHFDGTAWTRIHSEGIPTLKAVWGRSSNDVFALGYNVWHFDGSMWDWQKLPGNTQGTSHLYGTPGFGAYVVARELIFRYDFTQ